MGMGISSSQVADCYRWNNAPEILCYECDSCKAGVLENIRRDWHKLSVLNIVMLVLLIAIYCIGCCAFRNTRRSESDYPYGENRMSKVRPRWDFYWYLFLSLSLTYLLPRIFGFFLLIHIQFLKNNFFICVEIVSSKYIDFIVFAIKS